VPRALDVWLPLPVPAFRFLAPHGHDAPQRGARVVVPWQGGVRIGIIADVTDVGVAAALELREAVAILDHHPWLLAPALRMLAAQATRTATPVGLALVSGLGVGLEAELEHEVALHAGVEREALGPAGAELQAERWIDAQSLASDALTTWREHGLVRERVRVRPETERVLAAVRAADHDLSSRARANWRAALEWLERYGPVASAAELARAADVPVGAARALVSHGYAAYVERERPLPAAPWVVPTSVRVTSSAAGTHSEARTALVHGGWRSDRLEHLTREVVEVVRARHQALVLVPEASAIDSVARHLAAEVATLALRADQAAAQRTAIWHEVAAGTPLVLVGTYPVLTAPLVRLAQVHVWDAGSTSYKQVAGTRSVARRDAQVLAESARAQRFEYDAVATAELRAARPEHTVALQRPPLRFATSDLRLSTTWPLGPDLIRVLRQVAERQRQAVVFVPRRGFAAGLACRSCGAPVMCPHCDLPLRWHAQRERLRCHQCGHQRSAPAGCAECGEPHLAPLPGAGTEWVAREVGRIVAPLPVWVVDADHRSDLTPLYEGAAGVVVATSAALRLEPPPVLSLIAFTLGDALYGHEDFRAEEQALRSLLQAAELGAERRPLLLVQTFQSDHPLWRVLASDDLGRSLSDHVDAIAQRRARFGYPPASQWARVQVSHRDRGRAQAAAAAAAATLRTAGVPDEALLGPVAASVARVRDRYVVHLFVRASDDVTLAGWLERIDRRPGDGVQVRIDVDPYDVHVHLE